ERGVHPADELFVAIEGHVDEARPNRDPVDLVGLDDASGLALGYEPVAPHDPLAPSFLRDEGELVTAISTEHSTAARVTVAPARPDGVVADEPRAGDRYRRAHLPVDTLALGAPFADPRKIGDHVVQRLGTGADDDLCTVLGQPPPLVLRRHCVLPRVRSL